MFLFFFDDIIIYSANWKDHWSLIRLVFQVLLNSQLFAKNSKCRFGMLEVDYLGHIVSGRGVAVDQSKIQAVGMANTQNSALRVFFTPSRVL